MSDPSDVPAGAKVQKSTFNYVFFEFIQLTNLLWNSTQFGWVFFTDESIAASVAQKLCNFTTRMIITLHSRVVL